MPQADAVAGLPRQGSALAHGPGRETGVLIVQAESASAGLELGQFMLTATFGVHRRHKLCDVGPHVVRPEESRPGKQSW